MPEGGFFDRRTISPTSLTIVILLHAAAITALALSKMEMPKMKIFEPLQIENINPDPIPDPVKPERKDQKPVARDTQIDYVRPLVPTTPRGPVVVQQPNKEPVVFDPGPPPRADQTPSEPALPLPPQPQPQPQPQPKPQPPVRTEATMRSGDLQPPYPASEEQMQREGKVTIRLTIGTDGRVRAAEKVSATSEAFFTATQRHALRFWRFSPATLDGKPVESTKVVTVHFRLDQ
ncbi:MAG TPA: TonB family protein [Allosphingosinicella sp.]|nr:TonB family protein [Allosphingosinicella sp.]